MEQPGFGGLKEVLEWNWSPVELSQRINEFRYRTISDLVPDSFGDVEFFGDLLIRYPHCWKMIYRRPGEILGFWQMIPLTETGYELSVQGEICGARITPSLVPVLEPGSWNDAYFYSLSICPTIRRSMIAVGFSGTIVQAFIDLAKESIFFDRVSMCFSTRYSELMNRVLLHFDSCAEHPVSGKIYQTRLPSFLDRKLIKIAMGSNLKQLSQLYSLAKAG